MGKRKVSILDAAVDTIAEIALFIESEGMPATAKKFVDEVFSFFKTLSDDRILYKPCRFKKWQHLNYRCVTYKRKYIIAYLSHKNEIVICDFVSSKLLK
ncbi:type II toxin-antitoxin system RelE/ParE family toxin [Niabella ginsengisoli]|uniref:type II toxin-antitoxin system RelE/ParE family toxin n=1 Tax=Niabella ginsengisoli TaxID=522298 RepID=UPI00374D0F9E